MIIFPLTLFWKRMEPREVIQAFMQGFQYKMKKPTGWDRVTDCTNKEMLLLFLVGSGIRLPHKIFQFQSHHKGLVFIKEIVVFIQVSLCKPHNQLSQATNK